MDKAAILLKDVAAFLRVRRDSEERSDEPPRRVLQLSGLEDRFLFSASPVSPETLDGQVGQASQQQTEITPETESDGTTAALQLTESGTDAIDDNFIYQWEASGDTVLSRAAQHDVRRELVVVDTSTLDYQPLLNDLLVDEDESRLFDVLLLDSSRDGIEQITESLSSYDSLDAVHVISHGADGEVKLGSARLSLDTVDGYAGQLLSWRDALASDADLLFFGCNLAATEDGRTLVESLGELTGGDVAASTDETGHASLGGDWELEYSTGVIDVGLAFSAEVQQDWTHLLPNQAPLASDDPGDFDSLLTSLSPVGYWRLGEGSGATASDESGATSGTYNGATLAQSGALAGDADTAVYFDGVDDYVEIPHNSSYLIDEGTVQLWFNAETPAIGDTQCLFSKDSMGFDSGGHLSIYLDSAGRLEVRLQSASSDNFVTSAAPVSGGVWHHVAVSFGSNGIQLYLDGTLIDTNAYTGGLGTSSGGAGNYEPIAVGGGTRTSGDLSITPINQFFAGRIDEVAIIGSQLDASTIQALYAAATTPSYTTSEDMPLNVDVTSGVLTNDSDIDADSLTASLVSGPSHAKSFTLNPDGSFDYTPNDDFSGTDTFTYQAFDGNAYSNVATVTLTIDPVNDAPLLDSTGTMTLTDIFEDDDHSNGDLISDIILSAGGDRITDVDAGAIEGIAITSVDNTNGSWQYSTDGGSSWQPIGGVTDSLAVVLTTTASDRIRFLPTENFNGTAQFTFRAWDATDGYTSGSSGVDASIDGGTTAFSSTTESATITVVPIDVKILFATQGGASSTGTVGLDNWEAGDIVGIGDPNFHIEPGNSSGTFLLLSDYLRAAGDGNISINALHYVSRNIDIGLSTQLSPQVGDILITVAGNETLTGSDLNSVSVDNGDVFVFRPDAADDYTSGSFFVLLDDAVGAGNELQGLSLVERDVNVGGEILSSGTFLLSSSDLVGNNIYHFTPDRVGFGDTTGALTILVDGSDVGVESISDVGSLDLVQEPITIDGTTFNAGDLLVSLSGSDNSVGNGAAIRVDKQDIFALRVTQSGTNSVATATAFFEGDDVKLNSNSEKIWALATIMSTGDLDPTLVLPGGTVNYVENDPPVVIDGGATLTDPDSLSFLNGQLSVSITDGGSVGDRLSIRNEGTGIGQIGVTGSFVSYGGVSIATFTGGTSGTDPLAVTFNNSATVAAVEALIRNVTFENLSDEPSTVDRTVEMVVSDGDGGTSNVASKTITVMSTADPVTANDDNYHVDEGATLNTDQPWWSGGWSARRELIFDNLTRTENLTDFPVLVALDSARIDYTLTQDAGQDLRFVDADGVTVLDHEIESWDEAGTSYVWVKVPQINASSGTDSIWMYYGNAGAADGQNGVGVWSNTFTGVYHLNDDFQDASGTGNHGTNYGSTNTSGHVADGQIFNGVDDDIDLGSDASLDNVFTGGGTISVWIRPDGWGEFNYGNILDKSSATSADGGWGVQVNAGNQSIDLERGFTGSDRGIWSTPTGSIQLGQWHHVVFAYDDSSVTNDPSIFIDGVEQGLWESSTPTGTADSDADKSMHIGNFAGATPRTFDGILDEVRVATAMRSAAWVSAEYASMTDSLIAFGRAGVLTNDVDVDGDTLTATLVNGPNYATSFALRPDGSFSYLHDGSETVSDSFTYQVSDGAGSTDTATVTITIAPVNDAPTVNLANVVTSLAEDADTSSAILIADIDIVDDALGANAISLGGADAASFEVVGNQLYLRAGTALDYETKGTFNLTVNVDDSTVGTAPDDTLTHALTISNVNETPVTLRDLNSTDEGTPIPVSQVTLLLLDDGPDLAFDLPALSDFNTTDDLVASSRTDQRHPSGESSNGFGASKLNHNGMALRRDRWQIEFPERFAAVTGGPIVELPELVASGLRSHWHGLRDRAVDADGTPYALALYHFDAGQLWNGFDTLTDDLQADEGMRSIVVAGVVGVTTIATAGYAVWALRSGYFVMTALASIPSWKSFDLIPILDFDERSRPARRDSQYAKGSWAEELKHDNA